MAWVSTDFDDVLSGLSEELQAHFNSLSAEAKDKYRNEVPPRLLETYLVMMNRDWSRPELFSQNVSAAVAKLAEVTTAGGANDTSEEGSAVPWAWLVHQVRSQATTAARVAREWYRHLERHDLTSGTLSRNRGVSAFMAGSIEIQRGNAASARRWMHIAAVEDARADHRGVARTVLVEALHENEEALERLHALVREDSTSISSLGGQAEWLLTRWYLKEDVRRSDLSLDTEHHLSAEILSLAVDALSGAFDSTKAQGDALEYLAAYLLSHVAGCFPVRNLEAPDFENDVVIRNLSRHVSPALDVMGRYILVECKNWKGRVGSRHIAYLANRMRYCRVSFGILFAREGITGDLKNAENTDGDAGDGRFMLNRAYHQDGVVIAVLSADDLRGLVAGRETILQLLLRKHDEVRFGARA